MAHNKKKKTTDDNGDLILRSARRIRSEVIERADGYLEGTYDPKKTARKFVLGGAATTLLALSLLTGLAFSGPSEITGDQDAGTYTPPPVVMDIEEFVNTPVDDDDEDSADEQKTVRVGFMARFRQAVLSLPQAVRILIVVPLWAAGTAVMTLITFLWDVIFASPVGAFLASLAAGFAILLGLFTVSAKMLFPELPLRSILCKRNVLILLGTAVFLSAADAAAPIFWHNYPLAVAGLKLAVGASVIGVLSVRTRRAWGRLQDTFSRIPDAIA